MNKDGWITMYIHGREGFEEEVIERLDAKWMNGSSEDGHKLIMFWLRELSELRELKKKIGSRIIFKYRLHFYPDLEKFIRSVTRTETGFTESEAVMIRGMVTGHYRRLPAGEPDIVV